MPAQTASMVPQRSPVPTLRPIAPGLARIASATLAATLLCLAGAPAQAQLARTFVSVAFGNDANNCDFPTPCRTFQHAHDNTLPLGEITVLDPGGYGAVTINRAISIINDGVGEAGVLVSGGVNGITISAVATDAVSLRGLTVKGIGFGGGNGIVVNSAKSVNIENCAIRTLTGTGSTGTGVLFQPSGAIHLAVSNTVVSDNELHGILIQPTGGGAVTASLSRVEVYNSGIRGVLVNGGTNASTATINAVIADSVIAGNNTAGVSVGAGTPKADVMVIRSVISHNSTDGAVSVVNLNATLRIGQSSLTGNAKSFTIVQNGALRSYGDNNIDGNADGDPAIPVVIGKK
jgi:hypothetical protein